MIIREARKDEVAKLQQLNEEVFVDNQKYDSDLFLGWSKSNKGKKYFENLLNNPNSCCLFAEIDGKLVGYIAIGHKKMGYRKSKYLEIENIGVNPAYRSKGIGALLIKKSLEWAKKRKFQKVYVNSYFENSKAINFYQRNGFKEIDIGLEMKID